MTANELIVEVYENLGEPTNINPYNGLGVLDSTTQGYQTLLRWINQAIRAIATWKDRVTGRQFRYTPFVRDVPIKATGSEVQVTGASTTTEIVTNTSRLDITGSTLQMGTEARAIVRVSNGILTVSRPFTQAPGVGSTLYIRDPFLTVSFGEDVVEVLKVVDEELGELEKAPRGELFLETRFTLGIPTMWVRMGTRVYFNCTPKEDRWYRVVCYVLPPLLSGGNERPQLPPQFDQAIVLYATGLGFMRMQEMTAKYSVMQDFEAYMRSTQNQEDVQGRLENGILWIMEG